MAAADDMGILSDRKKPKAASINTFKISSSLLPKEAALYILSYEMCIWNQTYWNEKLMRSVVVSEVEK